MNIFYYDVAINVPLRKCFTYKSNTRISVGTRVQVSFGTKKVLGIVVRKLKKINPQIKKNTIKDAISIDEYKCFDKSTFDSVLWASEYYHHPIGEVFFSFIPVSYTHLTLPTNGEV